MCVCRGDQLVPETGNTEWNSRDTMVQTGSARGETFIDRAPRFVRNATIARDLRMVGLDDFIIRLSRAMLQRADASVFAHIREVARYHRHPPDRYALSRDLPVAPPGVTLPEHPP
ncbi:hypothetical protein KGM_215023 [Danaus plexippus plexippus]|uniref:Uncharacterized protein n=1 Tax=Danaus plexippus plexippus TaxID=278856 RepID=A0A212F2S5_DANPL|nr:hypothetical protein KGM_215023 [Danaus plexippus plexippus]